MCHVYHELEWGATLVIQLRERERAKSNFTNKLLIDIDVASPSCSSERR